MPKWFRYLLFFAILLALVGFILRKASSQIALGNLQWRWTILGGSLLHANPWLLLLSLLAIYGAFFLRALRWARLSRRMGPVRVSGVYSATLMGFTCLFLLGRVAEPVRPLLIARKERLSVSGAFGVYVLERIFDAAATAVMAGLALLLYRREGLTGGSGSAFLEAARTTGVLLLSVLAVVVAFLIYFRFHGGGALAGRIEKARRKPGFRGRLAGLVAGFSEGLQAIQTWSDLALALFYTGTHWLLVALIYKWVSNSFGGSLGGLTLESALLVLVFTMVGSAAQLPIAGGGAQVAAFLVFTGIFGVEQERAAVAAMVIWIISFGGCCLAGIPLLIREGWSIGELRRLAQSGTQAEAAGSSPGASEPGGEARP